VFVACCRPYVLLALLDEHGAPVDANEGGGGRGGGGNDEEAGVAHFLLAVSSHALRIFQLPLTLQVPP